MLSSGWSRARWAAALEKGCCRARIVGQAYLPHKGANCMPVPENGEGGIKGGVCEHLVLG
ncbi:protein of unknown function [Pseudomonas inefficax]|uniref:Uncharacterized protein n=1 Tax=Pseudomonas inefficax TaxID=2078786 RepID=A0AAQ1PCU2_9PSED|nr:protein of unknown function [Pseudomonas inefficax]